MLQQEEAEDFVIATGEQHSVRDFVTLAARGLGIELEWRGAGNEEEGFIASVPEGSPLSPGQRIVAVDSRYFRPAEVETLLGDPTKAKTKLGWTLKTSFEELVQEMVAEDLSLAQRDAMVSDAGFRTYRYSE